MEKEKRTSMPYSGMSRVTCLCTDYQFLLYSSNCCSFFSFSFSMWIQSDCTSCKKPLLQENIVNGWSLISDTDTQNKCHYCNQKNSVKSSFNKICGENIKVLISSCYPVRYCSFGEARVQVVTLEKMTSMEA